MKKLHLIASILLGLQLSFFSANSYAWGVYEDNAKITQFIRWEGNSAPVYIRINDNKYCYIPAGEKDLIALAMAVYVSKSPVQIHCRDEVVNYGGINGHKVHRVIAK